MKTKTILILFFAMFLSMGGRAQDENTKPEEIKYPETVVIKLIETVYGGASVQAESKIVVATPDSKVETIPLERASVLKDDTKLFDNNMNRIRIELQKWQNNGFHVQSMSSASPMTYLLVTTIILTKN